MDFLNLGRAVDPVLLMHDIGLEADPWQARALRSKSDRLLLLAARQMGKSITTACIALHAAVYQPPAFVLVASRSEDQSVELFRKMIDAYNALDRPVEAVRSLVSEIELANGSRIIAVPNNEDTVRCYSGVTLLILDEASRIPDTLIAAVLPMIMASRGRLILLSTPCGQKGFFYEQWTSTRVSWERIAAHASECPRFDPSFLAEQRHMLGDTYYRQEFECEFLQASGQVFSLESVDDAFASNRQAMPW